MLSPQTIGPFANPFFRMLAARALGRARLVFVRDRPSLDYAAALMNGDRKLVLSTDVAMGLPRRAVAFPGLQRSAGVTNVGLNISGLLAHGGYTGGNQFGLAVDYRQSMHELAQALASEPRVRLWMVPHVLTKQDGAAEDDAAAAAAIARSIPGVLTAPRFADPIEAKSFIAQLDFFVGARMHATIAAFSSGVPVIPLAYSGKFAGLYGSLGYRRVVDLRTVDGSAALVNAVLDGFRHRDAVRAEMEPAYRSAQLLLSNYRGALRDILSGAHRG